MLNKVEINLIKYIKNNFEIKINIKRIDNKGNTDILYLL